MQIKNFDFNLKFNAHMCTTAVRIIFRITSLGPVPWMGLMVYFRCSHVRGIVYLIFISVIFIFIISYLLYLSLSYCLKQRQYSYDFVLCEKLTNFDCRTAWFTCPDLRVLLSPNIDIRVREVWNQVERTGKLGKNICNDQASPAVVFVVVTLWHLVFERPCYIVSI